MDVVRKVIIINVLFLMWSLFHIAVIWGNFAKKLYVVRKGMGKLVKLRPWKNEKNFVKWFKRLSYHALLIGIVLYLLGLKNL